MNATKANPFDRAALIAGPIVVIALVIWFSGWNGADQPTAAPEAMWILATSGTLALLWLVAAIGYGWISRRILAPNFKEGLAVQIGLGVAAMLFLDATLGMLGWLRLGGNSMAWALIGIGVLLALFQFAQWAKSKPMLQAPPWVIWCAAPAVAVLLVAACSAPGWLWATEFGGYDALSYHLQLPKEWIDFGRIAPFERNVYSFLPDYMEAAFYHIAALRGDAIESAYACQLLHAGFTLLTAHVLGRFVTTISNRAAGAIACVLFLGTPWTIVVGSLAYDEMPTLLALATTLCIMADDSVDDARRGILIGLCAGMACGAKLTSAGLVAAPLIMLLLITTPPRKWLLLILLALGCGVVVLLPYLVRNSISAGNPVFPFAINCIGSGPWSQEQSAIWQHAHMPVASLSTRLIELWNQILRFGIGANPQPHEPWKPQWSVLPWLSVAGFILGICTPRTRRVAWQLGIVLMIQLAFWLVFTHMKSRFFLPGAIPMCALAALGTAALNSRPQLNVKGKWNWVPIAGVVLAWSIVPVFVFHSERGGAPSSAVGQIGLFTGESLASPQREEFGKTLFPSIAVNDLLDDHAKVLAIGFATPFYMRDKIEYATTWDRGPLSKLMREFPDQPQQWADHLREMGFTHLLIDETMLAIWEQSGWNDPLLTVERVRQFAQQHAIPFYRYPNNVTLYQLR